MDILSFALGYKKGKSTGGGGGTSGDERVKYVTFMRGEEELLKYPVISGDTCHDPVSKGLIATPTKEQTVSTVYTYSGWALTDGGAASSSALANVTEDRTVYVAFTEAARKYTINFYDGETLIKSEQVAYGTVPSYTPEKDGYIFSGFEPEIAEVTGDADYIVLFEEAKTFADASWEQIQRISESGMASQVFAVGDTREENLVIGGVSYPCVLTIAGFNTHTLSGGTGTAGMTIITKTIPAIKSKFYSSNMDCTYTNSNVGSKLSNQKFEQSDGLKNALKYVKLKYNKMDGTTVETSDAFFVLSYEELGMSVNNCKIEGSSRLPLFNTRSFATRCNSGEFATSSGEWTYYDGWVRNVVKSTSAYQAGGVNIKTGAASGTFVANERWLGIIGFCI